MFISYCFLLLVLVSGRVSKWYEFATLLFGTTGIHLNCLCFVRTSRCCLGWPRTPSTCCPAPVVGFSTLTPSSSLFWVSLYLYRSNILQDCTSKCVSLFFSKKQKCLIFLVHPILQNFKHIKVYTKVSHSYIIFLR